MLDLVYVVLTVACFAGFVAIAAALVRL